MGAERRPVTGTETDVDLRVLGPVEAVRAGRPVALGGRRQRLVLAALLVAQGRMLPVDRLRELVWGDGERVAGRATLYGYVAGLRRVLEPEHAARRGDVLVHAGTGYALRLPSGRVDAERFTTLVDTGGALLDRGRPVEAATTLDTALALWRGPAFADLGDVPFVLPAVTRLAAARAAAVELRLTALLQAGRHAALVGELEALVIEEPLRERGWSCWPPRSTGTAGRGTRSPCSGVPAAPWPSNSARTRGRPCGGSRPRSSTTT